MKITKYRMLLNEFLTESFASDASLYRRFSFADFKNDNRRFIFDPVSKRMVIGGIIPKGKLTGSHAEDWFDVTGSNKFFDRCVRGWVGMGGSYKNGIIHFAPPANPYEDAPYACIEMFVRGGATEKCLLRGAPGVSEDPLGEVYPELFKATVNEKWDNKVKTNYGSWGSNGEVDVYRNPTKAEAMKLMTTSSDNELRALITEAGDLLVWDAGLAVHDEVEHYYRKALHIWLYLSRKEVLIRNIEYKWNDDETTYSQSLHKMVEIVKENRHLKRIYGDFIPIGENAELDEYYQLTDDWMSNNIR